MCSCCPLRHNRKSSGSWGVMYEACLKKRIVRPSTAAEKWREAPYSPVVLFEEEWRESREAGQVCQVRERWGWIPHCRQRVYRKSSSLRAGDGRSAVGARHEKEVLPQGMRSSIKAEILLRGKWETGSSPKWFRGEADHCQEKLYHLSCGWRPPSAYLFLNSPLEILAVKTYSAKEHTW